MNYKIRFIPQHLVEDLLFCWKLTAVGHSVAPNVVPSGVSEFGRYGRMLRAVALFEERNGKQPDAIVE